MYQHVMLGETRKSFSDVSFKEGLALVSIIAVLFLECIQNQLPTYAKFRKYFISN
jgi:hypothetical protein